MMLPLPVGSRALRAARPAGVAVGRRFHWRTRVGCDTEAGGAQADAAQ